MSSASVENGVRSRSNLSTSPLQTVHQVGLDQLVAAPVIISTFFTVMSFMEGKSIEDAKTKIDTSALSGSERFRILH